jgi:Ca2+-binding RTX toxin-like protein
MQARTSRAPWAALALVGGTLAIALATPVTADAARCFGKKATIVGTDRSEKLVGTRKADVIFARRGNDKIVGKGAPDRICGGPGNDKVKGSIGIDSLGGGLGNDELSGGSEEDYLEGEEGNDDLDGGDGDDFDLYGGDGKDRVDGGEGDDTVYLESRSSDPDVYAGGAGIDTLNLSYAHSSALIVSLDGVANDGVNCPQQCEGDNVESSVENVSGAEAAASLTLIGSDANNVLTGGYLKDAIDGGAGDDILRGGWDDDSLDGGLGTDQCDGEGESTADAAVNCESVVGIP